MRGGARVAAHRIFRLAVECLSLWLHRRSARAWRRWRTSARRRPSRRASYLSAGSGVSEHVAAQEERAGLEALEDLCAAAPESPRSAPLRAALAGLRRENGRLRAALEEAGLQQEWVLGSVVKSSEADKAQLVAGLRCALTLL